MINDPTHTQITIRVFSSETLGIEGPRENQRGVPLWAAGPHDYSAPTAASSFIYAVPRSPAPVPPASAAREPHPHTSLGCCHYPGRPRAISAGVADRRRCTPLNTIRRVFYHGFQHPQIDPKSIRGRTARPDESIILVGARAALIAFPARGRRGARRHKHGVAGAPRRPRARALAPGPREATSSCDHATRRGAAPAGAELNHVLRVICTRRDVQCAHGQAPLHAADEGRAELHARCSARQLAPIEPLSLRSCDWLLTLRDAWSPRVPHAP